MKKFEHVLKFSETLPEFSVAFNDYANHVLATTRNQTHLTFANTSLSEKEEVINKLFTKEVFSRAGLPEPKTLEEAVRFSTNPNVVFFANQIIDYAVDMILPDSLISSIGLIADIRFGGYLDSFKFDLENGSLFRVSKAGRRQRNVPAQILEDTTVTLNPENREVTVKVTLPEILSGRKSIAKYIMKVMRSIETEMLYDVYDNFASTMDSLNAPLKQIGYSENKLISMCQTVTAYNQQKKAVIVGTALALKSVLPSTDNARVLLEDDYVKLGWIRNFNNYDVIEMPQVADIDSTDFGLKLDDNKIYVISPASDKIMKLAVEGQTLSVTSSAYDHANLSIFGSTNKAWDTGCITNSVAGVITLS